MRSSLGSASWTRNYGDECDGLGGDGLGDWQMNLPQILFKFRHFRWLGR